MREESGSVPLQNPVTTLYLLIQGTVLSPVGFGLLQREKRSLPDMAAHNHNPSPLEANVSCIVESSLQTEKKKNCGCIDNHWKSKVSLDALRDSTSFKLAHFSVEQLCARGCRVSCLDPEIVASSVVSLTSALQLLLCPHCHLQASHPART